MYKIALIDDDKKLAGLLQEYLRRFDYEMTSFERPSLAMPLINQNQFDAVILDVMLPERDGFEVCREIRAVSDVPILMLTARGDVSDRVLGLELGVDDYLPKPFDSRELVARIKSLLRRPRVGRPEEYLLKSGALTIDPLKRVATLSGNDVGLSTHEFDLLFLLIQRAGETLSRDVILDALKGVEWQADNRVIDVTISRLRQKLGDSAKSPKFLKTIWGGGYSFIATVQKERR